MFKTIRSLEEAIHRCAVAWENIVGVLLKDIELRSGDGDLETRLRELEHNRDKWEAQVEGLLMKAEGQYKAAMASEGRAKTRQNNAARLEGGEDNGSLEEFAAQYREMVAGLAGEDPEPLNDRGFPPPTGRELAKQRQRARRGS